MSDECHEGAERSNVRRRSLLGALAALGTGYGVTTTAAADERATTDGAETRAAATTAEDSTPFAAVLERRLSPGDDAEVEGFGHRVAVDDDVAVVGAWSPYEGIETGSAFVFRRTGRGWRQEARLRPDGVRDGERFGHAVAVDGGTVVVGAYGLGDVADESSGAVYVFERSDGTWEQTTRLARDAPRTDLFGGTVALDGDTLVVGGPFRWNSPPGQTVERTDAHVYRRSDGAWELETRLTVEGPDGRREPSGSVAVSGDTVLVGTGTAAYVFRRIDGEWTREARFDDPDPNPYPTTTFAWDLSVDGNTAVIGHPVGGQEGEGLAYVYRRTDGTWEEEATLFAYDPDENDSFGESVALHGDVALVGLPSIYPGGLAAAFARRERWYAGPDAVLIWGDSRGGGRFGRDVALEEGLALIGAPENDADGRRSGAVFSFASVHTREEITRAKYDLDLDELSVETTGQVQGLYNRQPFRDDLDPASIRTREQVAEVKYGEAFEESTLARELDRDQIVEVQDAYDEQFGPLPSDPAYSRDDIARAKYRTPFDGLSVETRGQVAGLYNRQPFPETLEPSEIRTREQIAEAEYGGEFEEQTLSAQLDRDQIVEVQDAYDEQFGPVPQSPSYRSL